MKRTLLSTLIIAGFMGTAHAENLLDVYKLAQQKDPQILQAKATLDSAQEKIPQARADLLPQLALVGTTDYTRNVNTNRNDGGNAGSNGTQQNAQGSLTLSQQLFHWDSWLNLGIAEKEVTQAGVTYAEAKQDLITRTTKAYFDVLSAKDSLEFAEANLEAVQRTLEQTEQRYKVGLSAITDVEESKASRDQAVADKIVAQNNLDNSYEELRKITGTTIDNLDVLNTKQFSPSMPRLGVTQWLKVANDKNLSVNSDRIAQSIAKQQISVNQAGHLPTLDMTGSLSSNHYDNHADFNSTDATGRQDQGTIGLSLNIPLYSGGATSSLVRQAQADYVNSSQQLEQSYRAMVSDINSGYNNVRADISKIKAYQQSVLSNQSALDATKAGYEVGTRTIVDVLDSVQSLYQAKENLSSARFAYINDYLALKAAAGTLSEEDVVLINNGLQQVTAPATKNAAKTTSK
ncbi:outer membrane channel protein TolC [Dongshaea marina]|uniref:outer membrane channel protein TolC n=1 Tax=Dongshaea marina TaxID=2047966 RepID=UPI000D3E1478|nr:outer membrane channel protein TolC [Dongshaea marina]